MKNLRLGCLASHGGSNLQAIIDGCKEGHLNAKVCVVISNNSASTALERARQEGIPGYHLSSKTHPQPDELDKTISDVFETHEINLVILVGYMKKLGPRTLSRYRGRVLNIHPALLPKFGGQGFYGENVHQAVLTAGEKVSGVTIHIVDKEYDHGPIVAQCEVPILEGDTADSLSERVLKREHEFFVKTLAKVSLGEIDLDKLI